MNVSERVGTLLGQQLMRNDQRAAGLVEFLQIHEGFVSGWCDQDKDDLTYVFMDDQTAYLETMQRMMDRKAGQVGKWPSKYIE